MDWQTQYKDKIMTAEQAVDTVLRDGDTVYLSGLTTAHLAANAMLRKIAAGKLKDITCEGDLSLNRIEWLTPGIKENAVNFHAQCYFLGAVERPAYNEGLLQYAPVQFNNHLNFMRVLNPNKIMLMTTPPDEKGNFNMGCSGGAFCTGVLQVMRESGRPFEVIVQVNEQLPRVFGEGVDIPAREISAIVEHSELLVEYPTSEPSEIDIRIGSYIVDRIPDGACLQLGLGALSNVIGYALRDKKHLGIHSEMLTESMTVLMKEGVIDNSRKTFMKGKSFVAFSLGKRWQYDFCHQNPDVFFGGFHYVNHVYNIAQNDKMISINTAMGTDLMGQVSSESIGHRQFSGTGGQVDYVRGAQYSKGGHSYICIPSAIERKDGTLGSRIVLDHAPGTAITTGRTDVMSIVTEYGCAELFGRTLPQRAEALIGIAHPQFRDELRFQAKKRGLLR